jgi:hypothetical protein
MIELLERAVLVAIVTSLGAAAAVSLGARFASRLRALPPDRRTLAIEVALVLPWIAPAIVLGAALAPSAAALLWPSFDHCAVHDDLHDHLCLIHPPSDTSAAWWAALGALFLVPTSVRATRAASGLWRAHRDIAAIRLAARPAGDGTMRLESELPICAVVGLTRPAILVSDGARAAIGPGDLVIMLAHERAHVARRDVLRHALARLAAAALAPRAAQALLDELRIAREQACDEAAAAACGERLRVAEAILSAARIFGDHPALAGDAVAAFGPGALQARVSSLLADPLTVPRIAISAAAGALAGVLAALPTLHHVLETLLGALLR